MTSSKKLKCPSCKLPTIRRIPREGFWQKYILSLFGYYPWKCSRCTNSFMLHKRDKRKRRRSSSGDDFNGREETGEMQSGT